jgi:hypothetical protein
MWKYSLNHGQAKGSIIKLYKGTCFKKFPLPQDPAKITDEMLTQAFTHLKQYQQE